MERLEQKSWLLKLQEKWKLKSLFQVIMVLWVFACTGFSVLFIKKPLFKLLNLEHLEGWFFYVIYLILILPIYQILLLFYGFISGQFSFFWVYEKKFFRRIFRKKK